MPHTGTRFMNNIFREGVNFSFISDFHLQQQHRLDYKLGMDEIVNKNMTRKWWEENVTPFYSDENKNSNKILFHYHHVNPYSNLPKLLKKNKPSIPVISSIRDPLLIINTMAWILYSLKNIHITEQSEEDRKDIANRVAIRLENILSIPKNNIFVLPVDLFETESEENRQIIISSMMKHCNIEVNNKILSMASMWNRIGDTGQTKKIHTRNRAEEQQLYKEAIINKDSDFLKEHFQIELACLSGYNKLRKQLIKIGYKPIW
jgi:hypothetical protein